VYVSPLTEWSYTKNAEDLLIVKDAKVAQSLITHATWLARDQCVLRSSLPPSPAGVGRINPYMIDLFIHFICQKIVTQCYIAELLLS